MKKFLLALLLISFPAFGQALPPVESGDYVNGVRPLPEIPGLCITGMDQNGNFLRHDCAAGLGVDGTIAPGLNNQLAYYAGIGQNLAGLTLGSGVLTGLEVGVNTSTGFATGGSTWLKSIVGTGVNGVATGYNASSQSLFLSGTYTGSGTAPYALLSITDNATDLTQGTALTGLWIAHSMGTSAGEGSRYTLKPILTIANAVPCSGVNCFFTPLFPQIYVSANMGGSEGALKSDTYGGASLVQLESGATYINSAVGWESDVSVQTGASVGYKSIASFIAVNSDAVGGSLFNAMAVFTIDNTSTYKWPKGITFGRPDSTWPFDTSSNIIDTTAPNAGSRVALNGIDFSGVTFSGCAFKSVGFCVDTTGNITSSGTLNFAYAGTATPCTNAGYIPIQVNGVAKKLMYCD